MGEFCSKVGVVFQVEGSELNIKWESCVVRKGTCGMSVEGSEMNIKWESCVVRYVWYVGWKDVR